MQRADRDHQRGEEMQAAADALEAEQHDAEEARLEEEGGQHLVAHQRPEHRPGLVGEHAPVGAELVAHDDAGDDAHAEGDGEDLLPVVEEVEVDLSRRPQPQRLEHGEIAGEPDREGREDDVERDGEGELHPGQHDRIPSFEHDAPLSSTLRDQILSRDLDICNAGEVTVHVEVIALTGSIEPCGVDRAGGGTRIAAFTGRETVISPDRTRPSGGVRHFARRKDPAPGSDTA